MKKNNKFIRKFVKEINSNSNFSMYEVIIIVLISICFGIIVGYILTYTNSNIYTLRSDSNLNDIVTTYNDINKYYYKDVDNKKLSEAAVSAMINSLDDPNTSYISDKLNDDFNESINGQFVGIGVTIKYDGEYNKVISVNKGIRLIRQE